MVAGKLRQERAAMEEDYRGLGGELWVTQSETPLRVLEGVLWLPNIFPSSWEELPLKGNIEEMLVHL